MCVPQLLPAGESTLASNRTGWALFNVRGKWEARVSPAIAAPVEPESEAKVKMKRKDIVSLALISVALGSGLASAAKAGELRAGASKIAITPTADEFPYQIDNEKPFVGVHDDVFVRALVLDDGAHRVAIVSAEVTAIPNAQKMVKVVADAAQIPVTNVMLTASHTHNSLFVFYRGRDITPAQQMELDRLEKNTAQVVRDAVSRLQPARISFGRGKAYANINNGEEAGSESWFDGAGSSDKTLDVLRVETTAGKPLALMLNYATHAEVMYRSVTRDGGYEVTGDLPGATSRLLEERAALAPVVLFTSAAEGDQLSVFKSLQPDAQLPGIDAGASGWALLDLQARRIASAAIDVIGTMRGGIASVTIGTATSEVSCPGEKRSVDRATGKVISTDAPLVTIPISVFRINDIALAGVTADIASNIGVAIKSASPVPQTSVITMLAGSVGYVLNDAAYKNPGHGAMGSPIKPGCAQPALAKGIAQLVKSQK